ncbi:hypothetical protein KP509_34G010300 [Ceratopteris richardii]|uniref:Fe2OG dioxygenase domain-containing protein n=1 Tax=Ceratopteris richardii TaxID=49495 RepID=A0A8T2QIB4_CERRI|nr:hypothetical protein KP509_34G010300 [Ceratopteris richardii]
MTGGEVCGLLVASPAAMENAASDHEDEVAMEGLKWEEPVQSVQELVEKVGVRKVPSMYIRPMKDRPTRAKRGAVAAIARDSWIMDRLPAIDYAALQDEKKRHFAAKELAMACEDWGAFYLINHPIPSSLLHAVQQVAKEFFQLSLQEKQVYANTPNSLIGYGSRMGTSKNTILDWGDYFLHYVWPIEDQAIDESWPRKPPHYRYIIGEYSKKVHKLYEALMGIFSENLGQESNYLGNYFGDGATHILRMNYYPPCPQPHLTLGLGSHSDAGGMTFLLQDEVPGLQLKKDNKWIMVNPLKDALLVNIGDQLQILSNGRYKSVEHRVVVNKHAPRITIAIFCNPADDNIISPAPEFIDKNNPPLYKSMTYGGFLLSFFKKGLDGKGYIESLKRKHQESCCI